MLTKMIDFAVKVWYYNLKEVICMNFNDYAYAVKKEIEKVVKGSVEIQFNNYNEMYYILIEFKGVDGKYQINLFPFYMESIYPDTCASVIVEKLIKVFVKDLILK